MKQILGHTVTTQKFTTVDSGAYHILVDGRRVGYVTRVILSTRVYAKGHRHQVGTRRTTVWQAYILPTEPFTNSARVGDGFATRADAIDCLLRCTIDQVR